MSGVIEGAKIEQYLLEKSRIVNQVSRLSKVSVSVHFFIIFHLQMFVLLNYARKGLDNSLDHSLITHYSVAGASCLCKFIKHKRR